MKKITLILSSIILFAFFATSCGKSKKVSTTETVSIENVTITGKFSSKKGVMHKISCYCYDSGFLSTTGGDRIAVCFKDISSEEIKCSDNIEFSGYYTTKEITPEGGGVCSAGEMKLFMVSSFKCK